AAGETACREGSGGAAFFLIDSGEAVVTVRGEERARLGPGHSFGELAMIDEGPRSATVTAATDLVCWGLTYWDFRPFVESNGAVVFPNALGLIRELLPAGRRGRAFGTRGSAIGVAAAAGPPLGGALVGIGGWRAIFLVNLPWIAVALPLALRTVPKESVPVP